LSGKQREQINKDNWDAGWVIKAGTYGTMVLYNPEATGQGKNANGTCFTWYADKYRTTMEMSSYGIDILDLESFVFKNGTASELRIYDHGMSWGDQRTGRTSLKSLMDENPKKVHRLGLCIAPGGILKLYGCNVGKDAQSLQDMADKMMPHVGEIWACSGETVWVPYLPGVKDPVAIFDVKITPKKK
jgi:hypothetical protein